MTHDTCANSCKLTTEIEYIPTPSLTLTIYDNIITSSLLSHFRDFSYSANFTDHKMPVTKKNTLDGMLKRKIIM